MEAMARVGFGLFLLLTGIVGGYFVGWGFTLWSLAFFALWVFFDSLVRRRATRR
jgi:hypothetical protein